jgi:hypothetical protein
MTQPKAPEAAASSTPDGFKMLVVPIASIHPNPWNPNVMDDRTYQAERESIREYGFIDPILVRPHPKKKDEWQIIDGEHRKKAASDEGYTDVPITPVELDDPAAMKLTVIFNETRGEADVAKLGQLLAQVRESLDPETFKLGLPYTEDQLDHLTEIGRVDWDQFTPPVGGRVVGNTLHSITLAYEQEPYERFLALVATLGHETGAEGAAAIVLDALEQRATSARQ